MIPRPLAWGIAVVLTILEAANVFAAIFVDGYQSDALVHFSFATIVGFMLGMREGSVVTRALTTFRTITTPPPGPQEQTPPPGTPPGPQEPPP